jgi:hypothetical protein
VASISAPGFSVSAASGEPVERTSELQPLGSILPIGIVIVGSITIQLSWIIIAMAGFLSMKSFHG